MDIIVCVRYLYECLENNNNINSNYIYIEKNLCRIYFFRKFGIS